MKKRSKLEQEYLETFAIIYDYFMKYHLTDGSVLTKYQGHWYLIR
jgi:hypothetical protein